jgi:outer membrane protein
MLLAATPVAAQAPAATAAARVGFVDVQRVLARSAAGVSAREQLEREKAVMQKEMDARRQELEKMRDEIDKKGALMTADSRREKQDQFERKRRDAARMADDFQKELEKKEQGLLQKVLLDVQGVVDRVGKQRGFHMVVERQRAGVIYAAPEADLTDEVIRAYDQEAGAKGKK